MKRASYPALALASALVATNCAAEPPPPREVIAASAPSAPAAPDPAPDPVSEAPPLEPPTVPAVAGPKERRVDFDGAPIDQPPRAFEAVIGDWIVGEHEGARGLWVDGSRWRQGTPSASLADQARRLYGERYAEFLDNVKAFAYFPLAVYTGDEVRGDVRLSVRFFALAGRIDQAAGIAWSIAPDGSYWGVRANPLEDNILFFRFARGKRTILETVRGVPTPSKRWHDLTVTLAGGECRVELDGELRLTRALDEPVAGRVGLWSKADSRVLFDDFVIAPLATTEAAPSPGGGP